MSVSRARSGRQDVAVDLLLAIALAGVSYAIRYTGLPDDGLWHDDAWVATGAIHGSPLEIFTVGSGHPGFTGILMAVSRVTGGSSSAMAYPAFVAGVLGAPLLFLALRRFGYRAIGCAPVRERAGHC